MAVKFQLPAMPILMTDDEVVMTGLVASPDGKTIFKTQKSGSVPESVGVETANHLIANGAKSLIDEVKKELEGE